MLSQTSQLRGTASNKTALTSDISHNLSSSQVTWNFLPTIYKSRGFHCGELFQAWEMWLSPHSEKPVGSEVGGQDPHPWIGSPVRNQACIVPRLLCDLLLLKLPHAEASKCLLSIFIFPKSGLDLPSMEPSLLDHFYLYIANILL